MFGNKQAKLDAWAAKWKTFEWHEAEAFFGPSAHTFRSAWERSRDKALARKPGVVWSWSWPAFLLFPLWMCYRRMWLPGLGIPAAMVGLGLLLDRQTAAPFGMAVVFGAMGRYLYMEHAVDQVAKLKAGGAGSLAEIAAAGGVSKAGLIACIAWVALQVAFAFSLFA